MIVPYVDGRANATGVTIKRIGLRFAAPESCT